MAMAVLSGKLRRLSSSRHLTSNLPPPLSSFPRTLVPSHTDLNPSSPSSSSPNGPSSFSCFGSIPVSHSSQGSHVKLLRPGTQSFRFYSAGESRIRRPNRRRRKMEQVMELLRSGSDDLRPKLDGLDVRLPVSSVVWILQSMNGEKIPALEFYDWLRASVPEHVRHPDICSLLVDNCGRLDDYSTMVSLLIEFKLNGVCLNRKAFRFLNVLASSKTSVKDSVSNVVGVLKKVGGSCLDSGICSLIEMFSLLGSVALAKYVIQISEQKVSYYNVLVKEMCSKCDFQALKHLLSEMRQLGCSPNRCTYNYSISSLCRNNEINKAREMLEEMQRSDCPPDALTFEILICYHLRKTGEMDIALELLNQMVLMGIEPRLTTNAAFIKAYFFSGQREEAYKFVISSWHRSPINVRYSLLASLYQKEGNLVEAQKVLVEMMEKGLRPNVSVYKRVLRHLIKSGETDLVGQILLMKFGSGAG
ncbi:hypothetical protein CRG98_024910 [Punica granatum]|uniref:Pentatricopeptide repeat-containing protein At1g12620-like n=1 Tax=Punica granatum TaxID=22663 RepID=A0A2I0JFP2_PUNGR|nr:hypothetical protein CRG98_024910 [Punica granatum]